MREYSDKFIEQYDIRSGQGSSTVVRSMSGGNQQKTIVAREIDKNPELLVAIQPTRFGLRLRSCGEHPQASDSVGINVYRMRYAGVMISGFLAGIGLAFTVAAGSGFIVSVAGYKFLALAVMSFGNWKPLNILFAALFFSLFKVLGSYALSISFLPHFETIKNSQYIYQMLPYVVTMIVLIFTSKKSRAPKAEGILYDKGQR